MSTVKHSHSSTFWCNFCKYYDKYSTKMSYFIELNLPAYNADAELLGSFPEAVCVCCLARNVPYVNLASCKHTEYLESFFKYKTDFPNTVCHVCHEMLRKIDAFKHQVEESTMVLNKVLNIKIHKLHNLQSSPVEITVDIMPEITNEILKDELPLPSEANIKEESDTSDFETEMPLSMIKKQKETKDLVKKELTLIIKDERVDPSPFMDGKYVGKLKMHLLSREELEKERELLRTEEKYQKLPFKCESCIIGFNREMYLKKHVRQRHKSETGSYTCDICKSVFNTEISLKPHHRRHFIRYDCKVCGKRYIDERAIVSHYNEKHGKDGATVHNKFKCKLDGCGFETHSYRSFTYHRSKHERYPCTMCDKVYSKWIQLRSHIYGVHRKKQTTFPCKKCDKVYKQSCGLRIHMQSVHNTTDRLPYCAPCRMHFRTSHNLKQHLRQHSNHITEADKTYMCDNCGARFLNKSNLKAHIEWVHLKKSDFKCPQCLKILRTARLLKNHIAFVHEKKQLPRDKMCDYCGKGFTMRRCLQAHIRTHTGERPYQCSQCTATFAHSASLYNHNKLVHNPHRERGKSRANT